MIATAPRPNRRRFLAGAAAATAAFTLPAPFVRAASAPVRIGVLLPYTGTYATLGEAITDAMKLRIAEAGETVGGRPLEFVIIDSEAQPTKATQNTRKLISKERVDFLIGPVHSGVALAMANVLKGRDTPIMIIPNAGANALTRSRCARNIFRASFSNWQTSYPCGKVMADDGHKTIVTMTWKYAAGEENAAAASEHFAKLGGKTLKQIWVPFPLVEFQAYLSDIAALKPDAVFAFFSGGGGVRFVKDYAAAGLHERIPLYGPGFITEGVIAAQGAAADGIKTTLHYADTLDVPANTRFRKAYRDATGRDADVFAVQGYDTGTLLLHAIGAVKGDVAATADVTAALETADLSDSPRGAWKMSKAHNPIQTFYTRIADGGVNRIIGVAAPDLNDPATGCSMG